LFSIVAENRDLNRVMWENGIAYMHSARTKITTSAYISDAGKLRR